MSTFKKNTTKKHPYKKRIVYRTQRRHITRIIYIYLTLLLSLINFFPLLLLLVVLPEIVCLRQSMSIFFRSVRHVFSTQSIDNLLRDETVYTSEQNDNCTTNVHIIHVYRNKMAKGSR